jgi:tRNA-(ms[2]io[6]A)-hydroxylase
MLAHFPILQCVTPDSWVTKALQQQDILLIDHAHCEKKAASTAIALMFRYPEKIELIEQLSRLAREELRHFEQVLKFLNRRAIPFKHLEPSRYARGLLGHCRTHEPAKLIDSLIIGAFVEARSCERFAKLVPHLDAELAAFYEGLLASEARHYEMYLNFAKQFSTEDINPRISFFAEVERDLIETADTQFCFHSGA